LTKFYIYKDTGEENYKNPDKINDLSAEDKIRLRSSFAETVDIRT